MTSISVGRAGETVMESNAAAKGGTKLRILVVDDEPSSRELLLTLLSHCGAQVEAGSGSTEALAEVARFKPDVLISDIEMPEEDGYSFIGKVRSLPRDKGGETPAAALTAYARDEDRLQALAAGYQMHIAKPISASQLVNMVAKLVGRET